MRCPNCGAKVPKNRLDCPRCGVWLDEYAVPQTRGGTDAVPSNKPLLIALAVILTALLVVTFLAFSGKLNRHEPDPYEEAAAAAETMLPAETPAGADDSDGAQTSAAPIETAAPTPAPAIGPGTYIFPDSAGRYLTEEELAGLTDRDLMLARNEIFARHGYIFTTDWIQGYFLTQGWYRGTVPAVQFDSSVFNDYERANIDLIVRVEAERAGG